MASEQRMLRQAQKTSSESLLPRIADILGSRCSRHIHTVPSAKTGFPERPKSLQPQQDKPAPTQPTRGSPAQIRQPPLSSSEDFLAGPHVSFTSIGLSREVAAALDAAGFRKPSRVQVSTGPRAYCQAALFLTLGSTTYKSGAATLHRPASCSKSAISCITRSRPSAGAFSRANQRGPRRGALSRDWQWQDAGLPHAYSVPARGRFLPSWVRLCCLDQTNMLNHGSTTFVSLLTGQGLGFMSWGHANLHLYRQLWQDAGIPHA